MTVISSDGRRRASSRATASPTIPAPTTTTRTPVTVVSMRVTGLGHAGVLIESAHGRIVTDPWVNPAYYASWFPFPDNSADAGLDWDAIATADYLYISHL